MTSDYREALDMCGEEVFQVENKAKRGATLTRWDKLSIYLAVPEIKPDSPSIIFGRIQHRKISKGMMTRFLRVLVKAKAIHEVPNIMDMRRVSYRRRGPMG